MNGETQRVTEVIEGVLVILLNLCGLFVIANTVFVIPHFQHSKAAWFAALGKTNPDALAKASADPIMKMLDLLSAPSDFVVQWWFVVMPIIFLLGFLIKWKVRLNLSSGGRILVLSIFALLVSILTILHSTLAGLAGAVLISNWNP